MEQSKTFSVEELSEFNGKNGKPAYVGFKGKVYEVTGSSSWMEGDHLGHSAGVDLTEEMEIAPHAEDVIERMKVVGTLAKP